MRRPAEPIDSIIKKNNRSREYASELVKDADKIMKRLKREEEERRHRVREQVEIDLSKKKRENVVNNRINEYQAKRVNDHLEEKKAERQDLGRGEKFQNKFKDSIAVGRIQGFRNDNTSGNTPLDSGRNKSQIMSHSRERIQSEKGRKELLFKLIEDSSKGIASEIRNDAIKFKQNAKNLLPLKKIFGDGNQKSTLDDDGARYLMRGYVNTNLSSQVEKQSFLKQSSNNIGYKDIIDNINSSNGNISNFHLHKISPIKVAKINELISRRPNPIEVKMDILEYGSITQKKIGNRTDLSKDQSEGFENDSAFNIDMQEPHPETPNMSHNKFLGTLDLSKFTELERALSQNPRSDKGLNEIKRDQPQINFKADLLGLPSMKFVSNTSSIVMHTEDGAFRRDNSHQYQKSFSVKGDKT